MNLFMISASDNPIKYRHTISIRNANETELMRLSREGLLSLTLAEMKTIQHYFEQEKRDPTDLELETLAQTWSEHCKHKTFRAGYTYQEKRLRGEKSLSEGGVKTYQNLLKDTVVAATEKLSPPWCLSVFKDNAGVIAFDDQDAVSFKVETHNHPSALEPYGGAGTGIGGVIRDIMGCGLGGKPVLNTDVFCFGPLDTPQKDLPKGALHPRKIAKGVVSGVRDYGNRMGIPTANGAIYFDPGYVGNPLVFCGTVGVMPNDCIEKEVKPGDLVVTVGGRTGRDGIHGATFSSAPLEGGITSNVVQIGHAIMEKKTLDVLLVARDKRFYRSITDCGAGGFSSAIGELGETTGVEVNLEKAPLKYDGLKPWEIWVSESQERMVCAVPPEKWNSFKLLCEQEDVEAVAIGEFTDSNRLVLKYEGEIVGDLSMKFLHDGLPDLKLDSVWDSVDHQERYRPGPAVKTSSEKRVKETLESLLAHPVIGSKESVIRQYDHEVQGGSVIKPLMGPEADGPTDACVFRPKLSSWKGVAVSNGLNPEIGKWDPYLMARYAVDEAFRNLISVSGNLSHVAILDNFCWGDSKDLQDLGSLVRAAEGCKASSLEFGLPFISGKDSFNNTWRNVNGELKSIPPTLLISAIGIIHDVRDCISSGFRFPDSLVYLLGETHPTLKGSLAGVLWNDQSGDLIDIDGKQIKPFYSRVRTALKNKLILACHDLSEGGLAIAASEMAFGSSCGVEFESDSIEALFSESPARFLVEVDPSNKEMFENAMGTWAVQCIGKTTKKNEVKIHIGSKEVYKNSARSLKKIWKSALSS